MKSAIEFKSHTEIEHCQNEALKEALQYLNDFSPYYKDLFLKNGLQINQFQTIRDLKKIPTTNKEDLQKHNSQFLCVPKSEITDYVTTSGTLGSPVTFALTDSDLDRLAYNEAISLACSGIVKGDVIQLMTTMDRRFMAGLAYFLGIRKLGASIVRVGSGVPELQWDSINKFQPKYLICVPSFLLKMIEFAQSHNFNPNNSSVQGVICIGEPIRNKDLGYNTLAEKILKHWNLKLYSTYASTEMATAFNECEAQIGGHLHPELLIAEFLDANGNEVGEGEIGELTITSLGTKGMPLLRFRTGDLMKAYKEPCPCGRNSLRVGPVLGRTKQMIKYKGTTLYPPAIQDILNHYEGLTSYLIEIGTNDIGTDEIKIKIAVSDSESGILESIKNSFKAKLRVTPKIEIFDFDYIETLKFQNGSRKPQAVIDHRNTQLP
ncbi:phenylacetate--CoA ligase family protein [Aegicerativicinus sediminis]|uniref:phenylacetate--CoA ligase family protein n=1 Tax=Aegicerativicinus sediminis TaxID=2893202 RepID=UPI001E3914FD|nr:AMP-binding protein [Aegicerativicinus sediminis]